MPARLAALALVISVAAACSAAAPTQAPTAAPTVAPSTAPTASPAASPAASAAASPSAAEITALAGKWSVTATNPRVVLATGSAAGGTVTIEGSRYTFQAGSYKSSGPIDFAGELTLDCNATRCRITGATNQPPAPYEIRAMNGRLVMVNSATLQPYGTSMPCGFPSLPGDGVVAVTRTTPIGGKEVPAEVKLTGGAAGGVGNACSSAGYQVAWDLTGTRMAG